MLKNLIISILVVVMLFQTDAYENCRSILLFTVETGAVFICIILLECQWMECKERRNRRRKLKQQIEELTRKGA